MTATPTRLPSAGVDAATWADAHETLVRDLVDLIRIPSVNPPRPARRGELERRATIAGALRTRASRPRCSSPSPAAARCTPGSAATGPAANRSPAVATSTWCRRRLDRWTHDPFDGRVADGYIYGRGAVDMKGMVALELGVVRLLAAEARAAGRDPATDPIPGLRRDVLFTSTADEEAGGNDGAALARRASSRVRCARPGRSTNAAGVA